MKDISGSLYKLSGIQKVEANLLDQLVSIEGTGTLEELFYHRHLSILLIYNIAAPSAIVAAIQATGRDAILRGSGGSESRFTFQNCMKYFAYSTR